VVSSDDAGLGAGRSTSTLGASTGAVLDGRYRLERRVGRGGMADVRAADDLMLHRRVAVKLFRFDAPGADRDRAVAEIRTIAQLSHPGIVTVFDAGAAADSPDLEAAQSPYLVMELVDGRTLAERLDDGPLAPAEVIALGTQLARTLTYLHGRGVVHRDIKPANIMLQAPQLEDLPAPFRARLTDFGIARLVDSARMTSVGMTIGTANYLSPEQATGDEVGPAADIYALGLVLAESLTGQIAYPGSGVEAAMARLHHPPHIPPTVGRHWQALLDAMTALDPERRPNAADVAAALEQLPVGDSAEADDAAMPGWPAPDLQTRPLSGLSAAAPANTRPFTTIEPAAPPPSAAVSRPAPRRRQLRFAWVVAAAVVLLAVVAAVVLANAGGTSAPAQPSSPAVHYPTVAGTMGQHLRNLEDAVG
jgi:serine/threonine protein kinase